jgi:hypothetical protein
LSREPEESGHSLFCFSWSWVFEHGVSEFAGFDLVIGWAWFWSGLEGIDWDGMDWEDWEDWRIELGMISGDSSCESCRSYAYTTHYYVCDVLMLMHHTVIFFVNGSLFGGHDRLLYRSNGTSMCSSNFLHSSNSPSHGLLTELSSHVGRYPFWHMPL